MRIVHPYPHPTPTASPKPAIPDWLLMVKKFALKGTSVASFAPSQGTLCRRMLQGIDFDAARCVVELGAGTGPVTMELLKRVKPHTQLVVIEINPDFCARVPAAQGTLRQLTYMPWVYQGLYRRYFEDLQFEFVPLHLPPAGVYVGRRYKKPLPPRG